MTRSAAEIQAWMIDRVSQLTGLPAAEVDPRRPVLQYGLDSVTLVVLATDLEEWLGIRLNQDPFGEHPTIEALAQFLAEQASRSG